MHGRIMIPFALFAITALAQEPPKVKQTPTPVPLLLQQYDFGTQVQELQKMGSVPASEGAPRFASPSGPVAPQPPAVPKDFHPKDVPLGPNEQEAVRVSEHWRGEGTPAAPGADGRVLYSYGSGLPTVVCAPLRICIIELQAGEKILGEPHIGDSVRWMISPAIYGAGDQATSIVILKPQGPGLDINLLITTDRRAYYLRLISKPEEYVARIAFAYPENDRSSKWQQQFAAQRAQEELKRRTTELPGWPDGGRKA
jgi:type IV secretion system protein VirB9